MTLPPQTAGEGKLSTSLVWPRLEASIHAGHWSWQGVLGRARFRFYGRPTTSGEREILEELAKEGLKVARLTQRHSNRVVEAQAGDCGDGDALITSEAGLALRIVTADCVPVLLLSDDRVAAIHAGWRGIQARIIAEAAKVWRTRSHAHAVIGPAIGGCCYEVGEDVASSVAAATGSTEVIRDRGEGARPHLDLAMAVRHQLDGTRAVPFASVEECTRCEAARLWSSRREGPKAGRNLAFVWLVDA